MKYFKEVEFLVRSNDMKFKESIERLGEMLRQCGLDYQDVTFLIKPDYPEQYGITETKKCSQKLLELFPWLKEYRSVQDTNRRYRQYRNMASDVDYVPESEEYYTNVLDFKEIMRPVEKGRIESLVKKISSSVSPKEIYIGLEGLCGAGETAGERKETLTQEETLAPKEIFVLKETLAQGKTPPPEKITSEIERISAEPAYFANESSLYPDNYYKNMILISRHTAIFFRVYLRLEADPEGKLEAKSERFLQNCTESLGTIVESRYVAAFTEEEMKSLEEKEAETVGKLAFLKKEAAGLELPHTVKEKIAPTAKGCSIKKAFNAVFSETGFRYLDAKNFCFKAEMKSGNGFIYHISIEYGGHIWHAHNMELEVYGINFRYSLLEIRGLTPQSQEECQNNMENFKTQAMFLIERAEPLLYEAYGPTPQWFLRYRKYS